MIEVIKFRRDTQFRKDFFIPDSFAHPAKMDAQLCLWITERYTKPGDVILDPMAGMGTQMLACTIGRDVVLVELEDKFCNMCYQNWQIVKMKPQLGYEMGTCQIIQGDARNLEGLLADCVVTSPPYTNRMDGGMRGSRAGMIPYTDESPDSWYTQRDQSNIGNLPYGSIDSIVTSPPYEGFCEGGIDKSGERLQAKIDKGLISKETARALTKGSMVVNPRYSHSKDNIGNLKGETYLQAMLQVYQQCHIVLKPEGLMILVLKNFIRNKQIVPLDLDTIKLCEQAGFEFMERFYRKLPSQSFWRIIYHQKYPQVKQIEYEDVIAFRRL